MEKDTETYEVVQEAIDTMQRVAWHINDMKRKHEHAVRLQVRQAQKHKLRKMLDAKDLHFGTVSLQTGPTCLEPLLNPCYIKKINVERVISSMTDPAHFSRLSLFL